MPNPILKELPELIAAGILTEETAAKIRNHYHNRTETESPAQSRLLIAFGILGGLLVGLGIILIIAHNWDDLSRLTKTVLSFLPLLAGQAACAYALMRKADSTAWREGAAVFLFFAVGACISLISQIYHIPGNLSGYLLTWMLLCLPLAYVMRASFVSLLYLIGITWYAGEVGYWGSPVTESRTYWLLLLLVLPYYYLLLRRKPASNFTTFHNWIVPLSVVSALGTLAHSQEEWLFLAYFSLFGACYLVGSLPLFARHKLRNNGYLNLGSLGMISVLLMLSFDWFWKEFDGKTVEGTLPPEWIAVGLTTLAAGALLFLLHKNKPLREWNPIAFTFLAFLLTFLIGKEIPPLGQILTNLIVFAFAVLTIRRGATGNHLGVLNYGLLIIAALVTCRFFDTDLSFVVRGLLFVAVGSGFFLTNYWMINRRKASTP